MGVNVKDIFPHLEGEEITLVQRAYDIAATSLEGRLRDSGAPFLEHPLGVARIVDAEIGLQPVCVAAVFLHEASRMNPEAKAMITGFPQEVMQIVDGLDKISTINPKDTRLEAENYKRLIVQYSTDPRVTVIKIADRLEVMRNLSCMPKSVRERKCLDAYVLDQRAFFSYLNVEGHLFSNFILPVCVIRFYCHNNTIATYLCMQRYQRHHTKK